MSWTDERIDQLKRLWEQGMTASHIAEQLGGVSRNAVIGKAHRLGLQSRPSPVKAEAAPAAAPAKKVQPKPEPVAPPVIEMPVPTPATQVFDTPQPIQPVRMIRPGMSTGPVPPSGPPAPPRRSVPAKPSPDIKGKTTLLDLSDKVCKWPIGHPGEADFHFCGKPSNQGFPYCNDHCLVAYQAQMPRRDRRPPPPLPFTGTRIR